MNKGLWIAQILMGIFFIYVGVLHFIVPEGLPDAFSWMYDLSDTLHWISGTAEILGGLGLILPAVTGIMPQLVPLAAEGLIVVMIGAIIYHLARGEFQNVVSNLLWIGIGAFIAWGRTKRHPLPART